MESQRLQKEAQERAERINILETRVQSEEFWRAAIAFELLNHPHQELILNEAKEISSEAYQIVSRTILACTVIARGLMK